MVSGESMKVYSVSNGGDFQQKPCTKCTNSACLYTGGEGGGQNKVPFRGTPGLRSCIIIVNQRRDNDCRGCAQGRATRAI